MTDFDENVVKEKVANASIEELYGLCADLGIFDPNEFTQDMFDIMIYLMWEHPDITEEELLAYLKSYNAYKKYRK